MHDIFPSSTATTRTLADFHVKRMVLSPEHWRMGSLPVTLNWTAVAFDESNVEEIPEDVRGVYSFVVQPGIAQHPACSYLLYIGMTSQQNFRTRFRQYIRDSKAGDTSRRAHITEMLEKWAGFLWFAYAPVLQEDLIIPIENTLLSSYLPPSNKEFPASVAGNLRRLFGT
jgi:hypothetical protein